MSDRDMMQLCLDQAKHTASNLTTFITECSNPSLRQECMNALNNVLQEQHSCYELMHQRGWYQPMPADSNAITAAQQALNTMLTQTGSMGSSMGMPMGSSSLGNNPMSMGNPMGGSMGSSMGNPMGSSMGSSMSSPMGGSPMSGYEQMGTSHTGMGHGQTGMGSSQMMGTSQFIGTSPASLGTSHSSMGTSQSSTGTNQQQS